MGGRIQSACSGGVKASGGSNVVYSLGVPETQVEAIIEPDSIADALGGEPVSVVADSLGFHRATLPATAQFNNASTPGGITDLTPRARGRRELAFVCGEPMWS